MEPTLPLYGPDGFHPSPLGTYLAALVIYAEARDKSPVGLPYKLPGVFLPISARQAEIAQQAAEEVTQTKKRPGKPWSVKRWPHADAFLEAK